MGVAGGGGAPIPEAGKSAEAGTTQQSGKGAQQQGGNGPGLPEDAVEPFVDAVVAAAKTAGAEPAGDPDVSTALQLGWLMGSILGGRSATRYPGDLGLEKAGQDAEAIWLAASVSALKLDNSADPGDVVKALRDGDARQTAEDCEPKLAGALLGADVRFARAYVVGRRLNTLAATEQPSVNLFKQSIIAETLEALDDLSTALPPHAARGVANSIRRWQTVTDMPGSNVLSAQCELWRTILAGEKKATELLEPENYLDAAERLAVKIRATATSVVKQYAFWVVLVMALFLGGAALLVFVPKHAGTTAAGLSGVLASLGLSWKGIGGTLGKLAGKLEAPLWGAEVDGAVTDAITLAHVQPVEKTVRERRHEIKSGDYANRAARAAGSDA